MFNIVKFIKDFLILSKLPVLLYPIAKIFNYIYYWGLMILDISKYNHVLLQNDFYKPIRTYTDREKMFEFVFEHFNLTKTKILYLEFGIAAGSSFRKFLTLNTNSNSKFYGFDTFEGLPENWGGFYKKGDMSHAISETNDPRGIYVKGLFQDTLPDFLKTNVELMENSDLRIIHMDADLYSSTIFTLSQLFPFLKKGDILFFDEYSVPLHEFRAVKEFCDNFYIRLRPLTAVNNYYQMSFMIE